MRSVLCRSLGLVLFLSLAAQAFAQTYVVTANDLYVRAAPGGFAIGTLYSGDHFRRQQTSSNGLWYWGRCGGTAQMCGWVGNGSLDPGGTVNTTCSGSGSTATGQPARQYLLANYAKCVNDYVPGHWYFGGDTPSATQINAGQTAHLYGNYDGTSFHHQITTVALDSSADISWRWVSDSGEAVMVKQENGPWAFIRRDKLPTMLRYKDGNFRTDAQGAGNGESARRMRGDSSSGPLPSAGMGAPSTGDPKSPERRCYRSRSDGEGGRRGDRFATLTAITPP